MTTDTPRREIPLGDDLVLRVEDCTNRYFGDYHRVKLILTCELPVRTDFLPLEWQQRSDEARRLLGDTLTFSRTLERMGVAGADVERTAAEMVDGFVAATGRYLSKPEFARRFFAEELARKSKPQRRFTLLK